METLGDHGHEEVVEHPFRPEEDANAWQTARRLAARRALGDAVILLFIVGVATSGRFAATREALRGGFRSPGQRRGNAAGLRIHPSVGKAACRTAPHRSLLSFNFRWGKGKEEICLLADHSSRWKRGSHIPWVHTTLKGGDFHVFHLSSPSRTKRQP